MELFSQMWQKLISDFSDKSIRVALLFSFPGNGAVKSCDLPFCTIHFGGGKYLRRSGKAFVNVNHVLGFER